MAIILSKLLSPEFIVLASFRQKISQSRMVGECLPEQTQAANIQRLTRFTAK